MSISYFQSPALTFVLCTRLVVPLLPFLPNPSSQRAHRGEKAIFSFLPSMSVQGKPKQIFSARWENTTHDNKQQPGLQGWNTGEVSKRVGRTLQFGGSRNGCPADLTGGQVCSRGPQTDFECFWGQAEEQARLVETWHYQLAKNCYAWPSQILLYNG